MRVSTIAFSFFLALLGAPILGTTVATCQDKYAVVVGVETYDTSTFENLQFADEDAGELGGALEAIGFNTTVMTSRANSSKLIPSTPKKILSVMDTVASNCANGDTLILSLSGHGVQFSDEPLLPSGIRETYFCPQDADLTDKSSLVKISQIVQLMNDAPASRKLLLIDSCRETVLSQNGRKKSAKRIELGSIYENRRSVPGGMSVLFSCSSNQFSWEHEPLGHSVFTYHVIEYLSGKAQSRFYDAGNIDLNGLVFFVSKRTNEYVFGKNLSSDGQMPVLRGSSANWPFGEYRDPQLEQTLTKIEQAICRKHMFRQASDLVLDLRRQGHVLPRLDLLDCMALMNTQREDEAKRLLDRLRKEHPRSVERHHAELIVGYPEVERGMRTSNSLEKHLAVVNQKDPDSDLTIRSTDYLWSASSGNQAKLFAMIDKVLARNPNHSFALCAKGNWLQAENYETALEWLTKAVQADPEHAAAWNIRGHCLLRLKRFDEAIADLDRAIRINPRYVNAAMQKANCFFMKDDKNSAVRTIETALSVGDLTSFDLTYAAGMYDSLGEYDQAVRLFEQAIDKDASAVLPYRDLTQLHIKNERIDRAREVLRRCRRNCQNEEKVWELEWSIDLQSGAFAKSYNSIKNRTIADPALRGRAAVIAAVAGNFDLARRFVANAQDNSVTREFARLIPESTPRNASPRVNITNNSTIQDSVLFVYSEGKQARIGPGETKSLPSGLMIQADGNSTVAGYVATPAVVYYTGKKTPFGEDAWGWATPVGGAIRFQYNGQEGGWATTQP